VEVEDLRHTEGQKTTGAFYRLSSLGLFTLIAPRRCVLLGSALNAVFPISQRILAAKYVFST